MVKKEPKVASENIPLQKIGLVSFTDPRSEVKLIEKRENYIKHCHNGLKSKLEKEGFIVVDPLQDLRLNAKKGDIWGLNNLSDLQFVIKRFLDDGVSALIFGCWAWNEPNIPIELAKKVNVPIALVTVNNPSWPGITAISSTGASFWESALNYQIKNHQRFILEQNENIDEIVPWVRSTIALNYLKNGKLILWGGSPALNMEHLNDDISALKKFIICDIMTQDQYSIVRIAEKILAENHERVTSFVNWLKENNCQIIYDNKMTTKESVDKQIAMYLAAKDIVNENIKTGNNIIGVSIKCQPELSVEYGTTPCLIPAFLPYPVDSEGKKPIIPTVCEGDIKGLLTSSLLFGLNSKIPPLFGDLKILDEKYFVIANCGAASAFYAANSNDPKISLSKAAIKPQCQGESGGAFGFNTPETKSEATFARLIRIDKEYFLQAGTGKIVSQIRKTEDSWGSTWPHTAIELKVPGNLFIKAIGTNHLSLTLGNYMADLRHFSKLLSIPLIELDKEKSIRKFFNRK
ncbi:MAG: fucose isomerase [Candidatus Heimdallarchaeota archaeon]